MQFLTKCSGVLRVRRSLRILALAFALGAAAAGHAEDAASLRQELDGWRSKIEQIDAQITDTTRDSGAIKDATEAYTAKEKATAATGAALQERGQQLAVRLAKLETEHAAAEKACRKTTTTTQEYEAALTQCQKARQAYQEHADAYRAEQRRLSTDDGAYHGAAHELQTEYNDIEKKRQDLLAAQAALHQSRQAALGHFNELRDRLTALQSSAK